MTRTFTLTAVAFIGLVSGTMLTVAFAQSGGELTVPREPDAAFEPLLRGPVHEAFAEQYSENRKPELLVTKQPPALVDELPPEIRPEGEDVAWIPGYWGWDDEREDFIWISGVWRKLPPQQRWLPGYWTEAEGGWSWVSGTWVNQAVEELHYLPEPPETLELGAVGDQPSEEHFWVPGTWRYQVDRYSWRPGYWSQGYADWVWVPARYIWTPRGCIYSGGYWDYPLPARGFLYAPAYFHQPVYLTAGYRYTPSVFIASNLLLDHFWVRPGYGHYYFGDYYGPRYANWGISPWFRFTSGSRFAYDPLFSYYRHQYRGSWQNQRNQWSRNHDWYVAHENWRPARRWGDQTIIQNNVVNIDARNYTNIDVRNINNSLLGRSHSDLRNRRDGDPRTVRIDQQQRERYREQLAGVRDLGEGRRQTEHARPSGSAGRAEGGRRDLVQDVERATRGSFRLPEATERGRPSSDRGRDPRPSTLSQQAQQILSRSELPPNVSPRGGRQPTNGRTNFADESRRGDRDSVGRSRVDDARGATTTPRVNLEGPATTPSIPPTTRDNTTRPSRDGRSDPRPTSDSSVTERAEAWRDRLRQGSDQPRSGSPTNRGGTSETRPQPRNEAAGVQPVPAPRDGQPRVNVPNTTNRPATQSQEAIRSLQERLRSESTTPGRSAFDQLRNSPSGTASPRPSERPTTRPERGSTSLPGQRPSVSSDAQPRISVPDRRPATAQPQPRVQPQPQPRVQPQPQPRVQPQPQPRVQPQPQPRVQPQPQPRVQAQPQPRVQLQPQPQRQLQPQRQPGANVQPRVTVPNTTRGAPSFLGQPRTSVQPRSSVSPNRMNSGRSAPSVRPSRSETRQPSVERGGGSPQSNFGRNRTGTR